MEKQKNHPKMSRGMPIIAVRSMTRSLKLKPFGRNQRLRMMGQTDVAATRLNWPWGQFSENVF